MTNWQPIETAERWETLEDIERPRVLLTDGNVVAIGRWEYGATWTNEAKIEWLGDYGARHDMWFPTHWMPLPKPTTRLKPPA